MKTKTKLNRAEIAMLVRLADRLAELRKKYDPETGKDIILQHTENGTVYSNIECALCALDTILQEY